MFDEDDDDVTMNLTELDLTVEFLENLKYRKIASKLP